MIQVQSPLGCASERRYPMDVLINDWLGLPYTLTQIERKDVSIRLADLPGEIRLPDDFFGLLQRESGAWFKEHSLPGLPLATWDSRVLASDIPVVEPVVPVIYGGGRDGRDAASGTTHLPIDIFGSAFFMLTRYEEVVNPARDKHDRFPATASLAYQQGFLERPLIDEYVEILWAAMRRLWPALHRKPIDRVVRVTCDLDSPYHVDWSVRRTAVGLAGDLLKRRSAGLAMANMYTRLRARFGDYDGDPYLQNIDWMLEQNERMGNRLACFFISARTNPTFDARYSLDETVIRRLLRQLHVRGHEIGLHPSYETYKNPEQMRREASILRRTLEEENILFSPLGGRQHYLRWKTPTTARGWESAGMAYDSTLGFADQPGFRCGTSREFVMYDLVERRPLDLRQRPLILMECSVIADRYLGLGYSADAWELMQTLKENALAIGGEFTLLWHNSHLSDPRDREFYIRLIS